MITINKLKISDNLKNLEIKVTTDSRRAKFSKIFIWDIHTFRDYAKVIDASEFLEKTSNIEDIVISAESINKKLFSGIYFVEFRTNEEPITNAQGAVNNQTLGVVANLFIYRECLLNKTLEVDVSNCGKNKAECRDCSENLCLLSTLISALETTILNGFLEETVKITKEIEELCEMCHTCPDYGNTISYNGKGLMYQIINNEILLGGKTDENVPVCNPPLPQPVGPFIPTYIYRIGTQTELNGTRPNCDFQVPDDCYKEIAYWYMPGGEGNYSNLNRLYTQPVLSQDNLYETGLTGAGEYTYYKVSHNPNKQAVSDYQDIIMLSPTNVVETKQVFMRYYCCGCPR